ncbi:MAG: ATP-dependent zinc protease family protein [Acidimicrobiales bacterium]
MPAVGWREWVALPDLGVPWVKAKVDTGARTSSLHAWDVEIDELDGFVRFSVHPLQHDDTYTVPVLAPLLDLREVRSSNGELERRAVIRTRLRIAGHRRRVELTLSNRDEMGFRMLLGRTAVRRTFVVDPGRSYLGGGDHHSPPE